MSIAPGKEIRKHLVGDEGENVYGKEVEGVLHQGDEGGGA